MSIAQNTIREMFEYRDGQLFNRYTRGAKAAKGKIAGSLNQSSGYWQVGINGKRYQLSRLIWIYHKGDIDDGLHVDHINRDKHDNRIENLRAITQTQNEWNKPYMGCRFEAGKWRAKIRHSGKTLHIGMFETRQHAEHAYLDMAQKLRGNFAASCVNIPTIQ